MCCVVEKIKILQNDDDEEDEIMDLFFRDKRYVLISAQKWLCGKQEQEWLCGK